MLGMLWFLYPNTRSEAEGSRRSRKRITTKAESKRAEGKEAKEQKEQEQHENERKIFISSRKEEARNETGPIAHRPVEFSLCQLCLFAQLTGPIAHRTVESFAQLAARR